MSWKSLFCCLRGKKEALLSLDEFNDNIVHSNITINDPKNKSSAVSV